MKKVLRNSLIAGVFTLVLFGCKKVEVMTPGEMLVGKWMITSSELLGSVVPGDGSYLIFNACSGTCTGADYKASDSSTGSFTYTLNSDATQIDIEDETSVGGSYNYTWDILELTETDFRITASTVLGNLKIEMEKEE